FVLSRPGVSESLTDVLRVCVVTVTLLAGKQSTHPSSSVCPLQSSSTPVPQSSTEGSTFRTHARVPAWQGTVPAAQAPACPVLHAAPPPGSPLSITPSQSLS